MRAQSRRGHQRCDQQQCSPALLGAGHNPTHCFHGLPGAATRVQEYAFARQIVPCGTPLLPVVVGRARRKFAPLPRACDERRSSARHLSHVLGDRRLSGRRAPGSVARATVPVCRQAAVAARTGALFGNCAGAGGRTVNASPRRWFNPLNILAFAEPDDQWRVRRGVRSTRRITRQVAPDRGADLCSQVADRRFAPVVAQAQTGYPRANYFGGRRHRRGDRPRRDILLRPICCQHSRLGSPRWATRRHDGRRPDVEPPNDRVGERRATLGCAPTLPPPPKSSFSNAPVSQRV